MSKKRKRITAYLLVLLMVILAIMMGYYMGSRNKKERPFKPIRRPVPGRLKKEIIRPEEKKFVPVPEPREQTLPSEEVTEEDDCIRLEKEVSQLFNYLDKRDYIRHLQLGMGCYEYFKLILAKLTSSPPVPAGEGVETKLMLSNIYYFYRVLSKTDIRLIKEILQNESDGIELHLALLFRWLTSKDRCGDPQKIKPEFETLYRFAGFFLNTLGGRSYLYRRSPKVRLVVSYYCALIIHRADKVGKNSFGIDLFPMLTALYQEIDSRDDLQFKEEYLTKLSMIQNYYLNNR